MKILYQEKVYLRPEEEAFIYHKNGDSDPTGIKAQFSDGMQMEIMHKNGVYYGCIYQETLNGSFEPVAVAVDDDTVQKYHSLANTFRVNAGSRIYLLQVISLKDEQVKTQRAINLYLSSPIDSVNADTILRDIVDPDAVDEDFIDTGYNVLRRWLSSNDKGAYDDLFEMLTGETFDYYVEKCVSDTTRSE